MEKIKKAGMILLGLVLFCGTPYAQSIDSLWYGFDNNDDLCIKIITSDSTFIAIYEDAVTIAFEGEWVALGGNVIGVNQDAIQYRRVNYDKKLFQKMFGRRD